MTSKSKTTVFDAQRGWREARDIIDAALAQGWKWRRAGNSHLRLIPPNKDGVPVGVSGTPSDVHYRYTIIRQMRRSGFIWPWPPEPPRKEGGSVTEVWEPVLECSVAEVSNGGRVRKTIGHKPIEPDHKKIIVLTDDKGNVRTFSVPLLVRATFGHPPLSNVVPAPKVIEEADMVASAVEEETPVDVPVTERWEPVLIEGVVEGYEVNAFGRILPPKNTKFKERKPLVPSMSGGKLVAQLKKANQTGYRRVPVDEIVMEAFEARPSAHHYPKHCDGNQQNCALDNLVWAEHDKTKSDAIKDHEARLKEHVDKVVDAAPPITDEQRDRISAIMNVGATRKPASGLLLADLGLTNRTFNALKRRGIITVEALLVYTERDLWGMGLSGKGVDEVNEKLRDRSLSLRSAVEDEALPGPMVIEQVRPEPEPVPPLPEVVVEEPPVAPEPLVEDEPVEEEPVVVAVEPVVEPTPTPEKPKGKVYPMGKLTEVVVSRVYSNPVTGLSISVDADGQVVLPEGKLTAGQLTALSHLIMAITEDNDKLGARDERE